MSLRKGDSDSSSAPRTRLTTIQSTDDIERAPSNMENDQSISKALHHSASVMTNSDDDEEHDGANNSETKQPVYTQQYVRRKSRPTFTSALHDNHDLRRMACNVISSADSEDKTAAEMESDPMSLNLLPSKSFKSHSQIATLSSLPDCDDSSRRRLESEDDKTTNRRRVSDHEMEKVFGVAELAENLRMNYPSQFDANEEEDETTIERSAIIQMGWS